VTELAVITVDIAPPKAEEPATKNVAAGAQVLTKLTGVDLSQTNGAVAAKDEPAASIMPATAILLSFIRTPKKSMIENVRGTCLTPCPP
jgi:hypothetical protein